MDQILNTIGDTRRPASSAARSSSSRCRRPSSTSSSCGWRPRTGRSATCSSARTTCCLPYLAAAGIILFTPVFFIFAVWVYKIIRPHEKIGEVYERNLAEEALLNEVESIQHCPGCERRIDDEWIICPFCRTRLNRVCPNCSRLVGMDWSLCAWCGKDFERRQVPAAAVEALPGGREATGRIDVAGPHPGRRLRRGCDIEPERRAPERDALERHAPGFWRGPADRALTPRDPSSPSDQRGTDDSDERTETLPAGDPPGAIAPLIPEARPAADGRRRGPPAPVCRPTGSAASTFTIEGRSAPGLFVVGWIAALIGLSMSIVGFLSGRVAGRRAPVPGRSRSAVDRAHRRRRIARHRAARPRRPAVCRSVAIPRVRGHDHGRDPRPAIVAIPMSILGVPLDGPGAALVSIAIQVVVYVGAHPPARGRYGRSDLGSMGVRPADACVARRDRRRSVVGGPVIGITVPVVADPPGVLPGQPVSPLPPTGSAVGFALSLLAGVILAPFGEELFFRGFATTAWAKAYGMRRGDHPGGPRLRPRPRVDDLREWRR